MVSATLPVPAVRGPWQTTVRPARRLAPNSTKVHAPRTASLVLTMKLKLWNVKVSLWIHRFKKKTPNEAMNVLHLLKLF